MADGPIEPRDRREPGGSGGGAAATTSGYRDAWGGENTMQELRILLVTDRPAVEAFFHAMRRGGRRPIALSRIPVMARLPDDHLVAPATVAAVDTATDPVGAISLCRALRHRHPALPILGLLCCPQALMPGHVLGLLTAGVNGLLHLHTPAEEMLHALHGVARGDIVLQVRLAGAPPGCQSLPPVHLFSATNAACLTLLAQGLSDVEIGRAVGQSPHTIKHLIERLRDDVGARNRIALAAWAGRHGFYRPWALGDARPGLVNNVADLGLPEEGMLV